MAAVETADEDHNLAAALAVDGGYVAHCACAWTSTVHAIPFAAVYEWESHVRVTTGLTALR